MAAVAWKMARQALPAVTVATIIPLVLFYTALTAGSVHWAIGVSVAYAWAMVAWQYLRRRSVSGMLVVTWLTATLRASLALVSGHTFIYFALPAVETAVFGLMFVISLGGRQPLLVRLARDLLPSAADGLADRRRLIRDLSVLWAASHVLSALATVLLLVASPLSVFVVVHVVTGWLFIAVAGAISVWLVRRRDADLFAQVMAAVRSVAGVDPAVAAATSSTAARPRLGARPLGALPGPLLRSEPAFLSL